MFPDFSVLMLMICALTKVHNTTLNQGDIASVVVMTTTEDFELSHTLEILISTSQHEITLRLVRTPWSEISLSQVYSYERGTLNMADSDFNMNTHFYEDSHNGASLLIRRNKKDYELYGVYYAGSEGHIIQPDSQIGTEIADLKLHQPVSHLVMPVSHSGLEESGSVQDISHMTADILLGKTRHKRATVQHTVELLMVVDYAAYEWWTSLAQETVTQSTEADVMRMIQQYYAYTYKGIDMRMQSIQDETIQIKLTFVGLIVAKTPEDSYWTTGPSVTSSGGSPRRMLNASMALDNFQMWLDQNAVDLPAYDHAMLFTGYNLTYGGSAGNTGLAFKGSICRNISNSSVVEDVYDTRTAIYAAQQLGRSDYDFMRWGFCMTCDVILATITDFKISFTGRAECIFMQDVTTTHLNELSTKLQTQGQLVHEWYGHIKSFQNKLVTLGKTAKESLGARDDMDGNKCFSFSNYIMTPKVRLPLDRSVSSLLSFSQCSLTYFKQYIEKLNSEGINCMLYTAIRPWGSMFHQLTNRLSEVFTNPSQFPGVLVDSAQLQDMSNQLPGIAYTADQQCISSFGPGSYVCRGEITGDYQMICQGLLCHVPQTGLCDYILPADGTPCGNKSLCMKGKCVMFQSTNENILDNCPFGDQPSSDCPLLIRSRPYSCYNNTVKFSCCASCTKIQESFLPGCEYGNRIDTCSMKDCATGDKNYRDILCCWTCANGPTPYSPPSIQYETGISPTTFDITDNSVLPSCYEQMEQRTTTLPNLPNTGTLPGISMDQMSRTSPGIISRSSPGITSRTYMALTGLSDHTTSQQSVSLASDKIPLESPNIVNEITSKGSTGDVDMIFQSSDTMAAAMTSTGSFTEESFSRSSTFLSSTASMVVATTESSVQTVALPIVKDLPLIVTRTIWGGLKPVGITTGSSAFVSLENSVLQPATTPGNSVTFHRSGDSPAFKAANTITMPTTLNSITQSDVSSSTHERTRSQSSAKVGDIMVSSRGPVSDLIRETSTPRLSEDTWSLMSIKLHNGTQIQSAKLVTSVATKSVVKSGTLTTKGITTESSIKSSSQRGSTLTRIQGHDQSTLHLKLNPAFDPNPLPSDAPSNSATPTKHALGRGYTGSDLLVASSSKLQGNRYKTTAGPKVHSNQRGNKGPGGGSSQGLKDKMSKCIISDEQNSASMENLSIGTSSFQFMPCCHDNANTACLRQTQPDSGNHRISKANSARLRQIIFECEHADGELVMDRDPVYRKLFRRKSQRHLHNQSKQRHQQHTHSLRWLLQPVTTHTIRHD